MRLIVLMGEGKVGKTNALELLKKINECRGFRKQQIYFQDDVRYEGLCDFGLPLLEKLPLGIIATNDRRVASTVDDENIFYFSKEGGNFYVSTFLNQEKKLDWTEAFNWSKSNDNEGQRPDIIDEFFNFICK